MLLLPENRRQAVTYRLFTDYQLRTADPVTQINADRVTILDKAGAARVFEVISVAEWSNGIIPHCKAIVSLMQNLPDGAP